MRKILAGDDYSGMGSNAIPYEDAIAKILLQNNCNGRKGYGIICA